MLIELKWLIVLEQFHLKMGSVQFEWSIFFFFRLPFNGDKKFIPAVNTRNYGRLDTNV